MIDIESSLPFSMKDRLWEEYIKRLTTAGSPALALLPGLYTWKQNSPESGRFLEELGRRLNPEWWRETGKTRRHMVLRELMRIDDGRGYILPWLASVVRNESEASILAEMSQWQEQRRITADILRKAWATRLRDVSPNIRRIAWHRQISRQEEARVGGPGEESAGSENIEQETWLAEFIAEHLLVESDPDVLLIISTWKPVPGLPSDQLDQIRWQWKQKVQDKNHDEEASTSNGREKKAVWQALTAIAPVCPEEEMTLIALMNAWLSPETDPELLQMMAVWQPEYTKLPDALRLRWSSLLTAGDESVQAIAWQVLGGKGQEEHGDNCPLQIWYDCFSRLETMLESDPGSGPDLLRLVTPPWGINRKQQAEWQELWMESLMPGMGNAGKAAVIHLIRFGDPSICEEGRLESRVRDAVMVLAVNDPSFVEEIFGSIEKWQWGDSRPWGIFHELWQVLFQSEISCGKENISSGVQALARKLRLHRHEEDIAVLCQLWLSVLKETNDPDVLSQMGRWWLEAGTLPEMLRRDILDIWKALRADANPALGKICQSSRGEKAIVKNQGYITGRIVYLGQSRGWQWKVSGSVDQQAFT